MSDQSAARRAIEQVAAERRARDVDVPPEREELAVAYLVSLWELADRWGLSMAHYGRTGHLVDAALDVALAPKDDETRAALRGRRARRRDGQGRNVKQRRQQNRAAWAGGARWSAEQGERAPVEPRPSPLSRLRPGGGPAHA